jgi:hypothetical protein
MGLLNRLCCGVAAASLTTFVMAAPAAADPCEHGQHVGNPHCIAPVVSATPELDSAVLFGTGLLGAAGYGLLRLRARRRDD